MEIQKMLKFADVSYFFDPKPPSICAHPLDLSCPTQYLQNEGLTNLRKVLVQFLYNFSQNVPFSGENADRVLQIC